MKRLAVITLLCLLVSSGITGQVLTEIDKEGLLAITGRENDTTYVVNFWATWCSPCVKEIEYFEEVHRLNQGHPLKVLLVSLDFPNQAEKRVIPFLKEKEITAQVVLMTDLNYNEWIDHVDTSWSGAIPATLIFNKDQRIFLEQELSREELFKYVNQILN
jgi:thiol-disulfide isomerase/thioredoxin